MSTTFANTINGNPIYAARAESDKDGNQIDTTYAKLSDIPPGVTVDQAYNSSSTNAQSGTAVAEAVSDALSTINQVPASTSSDEDKVLTVDSNGDPVWAASQGAPQVQANWTESDTTSPAYIQNKPTIPAAQVNADWTASSGVAEILHKPAIPSATSDLTNDSGFITSSDVPGAQAQADWNETDSSDPSYIKNKPTIPAAVTVDQTYNSSSTNPQSGAAVAGALATVNQVPASTASDEDKVLTVNSSGDPVWAPAQGGGGGGSQVQADWTETDTTDPSYIQNKPAQKTLAAGGGIAISESNNAVTISESNPLPASTILDENKTLIVDSNGAPTWSNSVPLSSDVHAISLVNSLPASPVSGTLYLIPET